MEADVEIYSQALGGLPRKEEGLYKWEEGADEDGPQRQLTLDHGSTQSLDQQWSLHGTDVGPLHVCDSCVTWSVRLLALRFWEPVTCTGLPCPTLMQGEELIPTST